jgi:nucleotide-binding universal stress UspA family protein
MAKVILVGCDGSEGSQRAVAFASNLASELGARLVLATVVPALPALSAPGATALEQSQSTAASQLLQAEADRMRYLGTKVDCRTLHGSPAETLASCADEDAEIDLLVVGKHGQGGLRHALAGSVASRLAHVCRKPVVLVP